MADGRDINIGKTTEATAGGKTCIGTSHNTRDDHITSCENPHGNHTTSCPDGNHVKCDNHTGSASRGSTDVSACVETRAPENAADGSSRDKHNVDQGMPSRTTGSVSPKSVSSADGEESSFGGAMSSVGAVSSTASSADGAVSCSGGAVSSSGGAMSSAVCRLCKKDSMESTCHGDFCTRCRDSIKEARQSIQDLSIVAENAQNAVMDTSAADELHQLGDEIKKEIDDAMDEVKRQIYERGDFLKAEVRRITAQRVLEAKKKRKLMEETSEYAASVASILGEEYDGRLTAQEMNAMTTQLQQKIKEINAVTPQDDDLFGPMFKYDIDAANAAISSYGTIGVQPPPESSKPAEQ